MPQTRSVGILELSEVGGKLPTLLVVWFALYNKEDSSYSVGSCELNEHKYGTQNISAHSGHSRSILLLKKNFFCSKSVQLNWFHFICSSVKKYTL